MMPEHFCFAECSERFELQVWLSSTASRSERAPAPATVASTADMYAWPDYALDKIDGMDEVGSSCDESLVDLLRDRCESTSFTTAFSGVDAPGTSIGCIKVALESRLRTAIPDMDHLHAIEWYQASQEELRLHPHGPKHIAGNIMQFYQSAIAQKLEELQKIGRAMEVLPDLIKSGKAVRRAAPCLVCNRTCAVPEARLHIAGTPCTDWSSMGAKAGAQGATMLHFMCWLGMRRLIQEACIVQENVVRFAVSFITDNIGDLYFVDVTTENASDYGVPCTRERKFTVLRHKLKTMPWRSPLTVFTRIFYRQCTTNFNVFFFANASELKEDMGWAGARRKSIATQDGIDVESLDVEDASAWRSVLTHEETKFLDRYLVKWPNRVYYLNQNPAVTAMKSAETRLNTMIKKQRRHVD